MEDYRDRLDETGQHYLNRLRAGADRMGRLIDDLLGLSRVSRAELRREQVNLSAIAGTIIDELRQQEPARHVEIVIAAGVDVLGDGRLLRVALQNLLENAWKFTARRERARIEFGVTERDGEVVYYVTDNGAGFDMTYVEKLFGAFQRLHGANEFPGTGIGLATTARVIHRHGGRIWAEGEVDRGATFSFTLASKDGDNEV